MAPNKKAVEEKRQKKREYDRKRREKMKNDPELRREQQLKERLKYQKKLQKKQVKLVSDMTARERRECRKKRRAASKKWYWKEKAKALQKETEAGQTGNSSVTPPQQSSACKMQHILKLAERRKRKY
ncbi:hypothetical protein GE061_012634 [Apolygus lucorum]|uniref:Uncharacterized protein n=1 Tax=Apolygus lucorum TaxID=248454 RepID=A0A8S9XT40_APOLU|nr:hypothetical protein GE061_012634 [Apolygus lucorum]